MSNKLRTSRGGAYESRGKFFARVTAAPQKRLSVLLPWATSLDAATTRAVEIQTLVNRLREAGEFSFVEKVIEIAGPADAAKMAALGRKVDGIVAGTLERREPVAPAAGPITFRKLAEQWTSGELHALYPDHVAAKKTSDEDDGRLGKYVFPVVQDVALADFTLELGQEVMRRIPREKASSTRRHVAQLLVRVLNLAVYPCRILKASPLPRGFLPKLGPGKALAYLYPDEDAALMKCAGVPLVHRVLYGFLSREGMRSDEAQKLQWRDVDLARGTVRLDENKTDDPRGPWTLDPGVADALDAWRALNQDAEAADLVFPNLHQPYRLAEVLREHLQIAGVTRSELFERSKNRRPMRVHDTRATFITLALATGKTETWVSDRTGHKSSQMINRYRRAARSVEELDLGWLAPLDAAVPELAAANAAAERGGRALASPARAAAKAASSQRFRRRDSNPDKRIQNSLDAPTNEHIRGDSGVRTEKDGDDRIASEHLPPRSAAASPRARLIADLADRIRELAIAGDVHAMRAAQQALDAIVAAPGGESAPVVDLAHERARRGP